MTLIDDYFANVQPTKRQTLKRIRKLAKKVVPEADETISYGMPTLKYRGKPFLGFDAHAHHIGIYPFSGDVIEALKEKLTEYATTKGAIRIPLDKPISEEILRAVINCRLREIRVDGQ